MPLTLEKYLINNNLRFGKAIIELKKSWSASLEQQSTMSEVTFDPAAFVELLGKLIGENRNLQNNPPTNVPQEDLASDHVLRVLEPYSVDKGGPLIVRRETFVAGRGNVLIEYPCANRNAPYVSFVGCHLDVVRARELKKERKADTHSERQTRTYRGEIYMYTDSIKL